MLNGRFSEDGRFPRSLIPVQMRDAPCKSIVIAATGVAAVGLLMFHGMSFDVFSARSAIGTVTLLAPFAFMFDAKRIPQFSNLLTGFLCMVVFNVFLTILTYAGTPLGAPLVDDQLAAVDRVLGVSVPAIVDWSRNHRAWEWSMNRIYFSVFPSTLLALIVLGFDADVRRLREFVWHYILAGLFTTILYFYLPAAGPFSEYGFEARADQQRYLEHFHALRTHQFPTVSFSNLEGLITFPSFHTAWALLLAYAFRHYRWLWLPMLVLNLGVVVSTLTTGWHYGADVVGGALTAAAAILTTVLIQRCLSQNSTGGEQSSIITIGKAALTAPDQ